MEITGTGNNTNDNHRRQFRDIIQLFIEGKMNSYNRIKVSFNCTEESVTIDRGKYRASLFMVHSMLKTMEHNEIAAALEMPCDLLARWENEKIFKTLMYSNYKEFLIYLGELYT
jgi:hypothetical protein